MKIRKTKRLQEEDKLGRNMEKIENHEENEKKIIKRLKDFFNVC